MRSISENLRITSNKVSRKDFQKKSSYIFGHVHTFLFYGNKMTANSVTAYYEEKESGKLQ